MNIGEGMPRMKRKTKVRLQRKLVKACGWALALYFFLGWDVIYYNVTYFANLDQAKRTGMDRTPQDFIEEHAVPKAENAAFFFREVTAQVPEELRAGSGKNQELWKAIRIEEGGSGLLLQADFSPYRRFTEQLDGCLKFTRCRFFESAYDYEQDRNPGYKETRLLFQVLCAEAEQYALRGEVEDAIKKLKTGLHIAKLIGDEPTLYAAATQVGWEGILWKRFGRVLAWRPQDLKLRKALRTVMERFDQPVDLHTALTFELIWAGYMVRDWMYTDECTPNQKLNPLYRFFPGADRAVKSRSYFELADLKDELDVFKHQGLLPPGSSFSMELNPAPSLCRQIGIPVAMSEWADGYNSLRNEPADIQRRQEFGPALLLAALDILETGDSARVDPTTREKFLIRRQPGIVRISTRDSYLAERAKLSELILPVPLAE